jgi:hypothetical protein
MLSVCTILCTVLRIVVGCVYCVSPLAIESKLMEYIWPQVHICMYVCRAQELLIVGLR